MPLRSDTAALALAKTIKPTFVTPRRFITGDARPEPPYVDRRAEFRELRDLAKGQGNVESAAMWQRELDMAEARALGRMPLETAVAWPT
jgi:hypothetical protein